ncbi:phosphatase PAP2 family protein [Hymenobacter sp.]|uniref:phosphatase PAP2 family protein n=1 Tax=Hymenobacter sp. TaxID=1898978 RepID=UPI00286B75FE|nr:phosphatase PAP2 family protein [Hymenobacter sp.]
MLTPLARFALALALLLPVAQAPGRAAAQTPVPAATPLADTSQRADPVHKYETPAGPAAASKRPLFRSKLLRASVVPAVLIGYGISTINGHGFYSSYDTRKDLQRHFSGFHNSLDDYLQFVPYFELGGVLLAGVEGRDDRLNVALVVLKSEAIMLGSVYLVKTATAVLRPDGSDRLSFPSGHTAQAFLAASIVHTELRDKSQWYGVGAYTIATGVAAFRMLNDKHWQSDVVAGAGFGILSAHLGYLSHRCRWGRKPLGRDVGLMPTWSPGGGTGFSVSWRPR